jgi:hypothetical protein
MTRQSELASLRLPEFGLPSVEPEVKPATYQQRLERLRARAREHGHDVFVVYGDREHFANLAYLTGYDPRFEESLLIVDLRPGQTRKPRLLVGNEGWGFCHVSPVIDELEVVLYQPLSLLGQPRDRSKALADILREAGIAPGCRVGTAGWKHYGPSETATPETWLEIPSYVVDTLRELAGDRTAVRNANALLMGCDGMRIVNEPDQIARFEFVASHCSQCVRHVLFGLRPGMSELEAAGLMGLNGLPLSAHTMLCTGDRATLGMASPTMRRIQRGDRCTTACSLWGALNARAGFVVASAQELPASIQDYVERLVAPYFEAVVAWYETRAIGATGGDLYAAVHERIGDPFFGVSLNPGHFIHLDEWVNSPVAAGSAVRLASGMMLQADVIPATGTEYYTTNIEDGVVLADERLRAALARDYPEAWERIRARRAFMHDDLGIRLRPEVLPMSNIPAYLPPYLLSPQQAMRMARG